MNKKERKRVARAGIRRHTHMRGSLDEHTSEPSEAGERPNLLRLRQRSATKS